MSSALNYQCIAGTSVTVLIATLKRRDCIKHIENYCQPEIMSNDRKKLVFFQSNKGALREYSQRNMEAFAKDTLCYHK